MESELTLVQHTFVASEDAQHKGESTLAGAQHALVSSEEARQKVEDEASRLADE